MDMGQYLEIFIEETKEHLQGLNRSLLQLEKSPGDSTVLNEIFRVAHTLKGMSGAMGFSRMSRLTHDMEDVLQAVRSGEMQTTPGIVDLLFKCLDALENYCNTVVDTGSEGTEEYLELIQALALSLSSKGGAAPAEKPAAQAEPVVNGIRLDQYDQNIIKKAIEDNEKVYEICIKLNKSCVLKAARSFLIFRALEKRSVIIKSVPAVQDIEDEKFDLQFTVVVISKESKEVLCSEITSISEVEEASGFEITSSQLKNLPSDAAQDRQSGKQDTGSAAAEAAAAVSEAAAAAIDVRNDKSKNTAAVQQKSNKTNKTVRVDIEKLDVLLNLVSELIIQKTRLEGLENIERTQQYNETVEYLERITTNLHDAVMKVRMVPVETVFNRFPRMIRDISKDLGKEVELTMSGEETELDRTVIDEIGDPLIHLLRNAVDHGIESIEARKAAGKPEMGSIYLRAYQDGNNVCIEVEEDGQGINVEKVRKKAIDKGAVSKEAASTLSDKELIDFLFKPSFSTAEKITDLSGRGVGLDVVKTKIESLGGTVEVESELGKGSKFIIRLPLTLAIIQALLIIVGDEKYAIQLNSIHQIINVNKEELKYVQQQEVMLFRNNVIPVIRLDKVLGTEKEDLGQDILKVVVVKKGEKLTGLVVDKVLGQQEIVQKSLGKLLSGIRMITSATILGDGNVALILDTNAIAK